MRRPRRAHTSLGGENDQPAKATSDSSIQASTLPPPASVAVVIPVISAKSSPADSRSLVSASKSHLAGSTRSNSADYETPLTSAVATPASFAQKDGKGKTRTTRSSHKASLTQKRGSSSASGLRNGSLDMASADLLLAESLQEEEYGARPSKRARFDTSTGDASPLLPGLPDETSSESDELSDVYELPSESEDDAPAVRTSSDDSSEEESIAAASRRRSANAKALTKSKAAPAKRKAGSRLTKVDYSLKIEMFHTTGHMDARQIKDLAKVLTSHRDLTTMWSDLDAMPIIQGREIPQPKAISVSLKPFQLQGVDWMIQQEKSVFKGGLLGDEMGMGKTIQAVSLIMSDFPQKQPTLVLVPPVALLQWRAEILQYTGENSLKVLVYHNSFAASKKMNKQQLEKHDVILISYNSLESIYRKEVVGWKKGKHIIKEKSPFHAINFHRIILDEAHCIKSRQTRSAKACFALNGTYRWCLSGTPVQNRIGEFFSLLRFLQVHPFADYACKQCGCLSLDWRVGADHYCEVESCAHAASDHVSIFNQELLNPISSNDVYSRDEGLQKLQMITSRIMLRRLKKDHTSSMELPAKEIKLQTEFFGEVERDFSSSVMSNTNRRFDTYVAQRVMLNNYANIFGLIMQMRQVADHPDLLLKKHSNQEGGEDVIVCNICDEPAEDAIRSRCKHDFCRTCVKEFVAACEGDGEADCPRCHIALAIDFDQPEIEQNLEQVKSQSIINRIKMDNWTSSTKIEMLVYELYKLRNKKMTIKSIVFSQFTSMLQLVEWRLRRAGFSTVILDGSMTPSQRAKSIDHFMNNPEVEIFLVSLKAGGVALNLTEASQVFIVDPWWNPAAEWQSADRCHRIGQTRPCVITRLCIEDSVESRIVLLQEKKARMIRGTVNNDKVALEKLTPEDMQFLFRGG